MDYVRITQRGHLEVEEGPGPLPRAFMNISGFDRLDDEELARYGWHPCVVQSDTPTGPRSPILENGVVILRGLSEQDAPKVRVVAEKRRSLLSELSSIRKNRLAVTLEHGGAQLPIDTESLHAMKLAADQGEADWKLPDGRFVSLTQGAMLKFLAKANHYRQACFTREKVLAEMIHDASSLEELRQIDLAQGWP